MDLDQLIPFLTQLATLAVAVLALWKARRVQSHVREVHLIINSRLDQALEAREAFGRAEEKRLQLEREREDGE